MHYMKAATNRHNMQQKITEKFTQKYAKKCAEYVQKMSIICIYVKYANKICEKNLKNLKYAGKYAKKYVKYAEYAINLKYADN
jgi:hypothetical protein